jgi:hypothetical protein
MRHRALPFAMIVGGGLLAGRAPGWAAPATFVSGTGTDTGTCPVTAPCATFQFAHDHTDAKGVISVVAPGSFGPVTISKAISIVAKGVPALILTATVSCGAGAGGAICVNAGAADIVSLGGLTIDLNLAPKHGIVFNSGTALHVHHSVIQRLGGVGIISNPSGTKELYVSGCTITNANLGVNVQVSSGGSATVVINEVDIERPQQIGIQFTGNDKLVGIISDSVVSGTVNGIAVENNAAPGSATVMVDRTAVVTSDAGVFASGAGVTVRIGDSTITGNGNGLHAELGATILAYPTNKVIGNGDDSATQLSVGRRR